MEGKINRCNRLGSADDITFRQSRSVMAGLAAFARASAGESLGEALA
jgi:hypothetical protein